MSLFSFGLIVLLVILMEKSFITASIALVLYNYSKNVNYSFYSVGGLLEYIKDFNLSCNRVFDIIFSSEFKKESKLVKKFKGSMLGADIGVKSGGFSSIAILATVIAIAVLVVMYFIWRF